MIDPATIPRGQTIDFGTAPSFADGPLSAEVAAAVATMYGQAVPGLFSPEQREALETIGASGDSRLAWLISDHIRVNINIGQFAGLVEDDIIESNALLEAAATGLTGMAFEEFRAWNPLVNSLIAWDIPAPPDYLVGKRNIYTSLEPASVSYTHLTLPTNREV